MPEKHSSNWRNRIAGGIAIAFGITGVVLLVIDGRWDNHDTTKPLMALLGGLAFIGLGAWYMILGAKAESWRESKTPLKFGVPSENGSLDISSILAELESQPAFHAECGKIDAEMRQKAVEKERKFESEYKNET